MGRWVHPIRDRSSGANYERTVVTHATVGDARQYALRLAREGFNVIVTGRDHNALDILVSELGGYSFFEWNPCNCR